jgi:hypothetical protein
MKNSYNSELNLKITQTSLMRAFPASASGGGRRSGFDDFRNYCGRRDSAVIPLKIKGSALIFWLV